MSIRMMMNGQLLQANEAVISVYDHGFLYGMGLFETFRTYGGKPFLLEQHLVRLQDGLAQLHIDMKLGSEEVEQWVEQLLQANELEDAYFRLTVSAGIGEIGLPQGSYTAPNVLLYMKALPQSKSKAKRLQLLKLRRNTPELPVRMKSLHYMNSIAAKQELAQYSWVEGETEGLMLDIAGHLAEGIVSNVFFFIEGRLCTPSIDCGILPGITRAYVLNIAVRQGLLVEEGRYTMEQLLRAEEIFVTNSIQEIVPVSDIYDLEGKVVWKEMNRSLTPLLQADYEKSTRL